jgi:hypothetical protein
MFLVIFLPSSKSGRDVIDFSVWQLQHCCEVLNHFKRVALI